MNWTTLSRADGLGRVLWIENLKSVAYRYPHNASGDRPGPIGLTDEEICGYRFDPFATPLTPVEMLKAIDCLEYQSCETPRWEQSAAHRICQQLRSEAICHLPGYAQASWEFDS
jgi:hypothetical protein